VEHQVKQLVFRSPGGRRQVASQGPATQARSVAATHAATHATRHRSPRVPIEKGIKQKLEKTLVDTYTRKKDFQ